MVWINVDKEGLERFRYSDAGMEEQKEVTENDRVQVSDEVADNLIEQYPDIFSRPDDEDSGDEDEADEPPDSEDFPPVGEEAETTEETEE